MFRRTLASWFGVVFLFALLLAACGRGSEGEQRACQSLNDCEEGQRCGGDGFCSNQPLACVTSTQCAFDEYCGAGSCLPAACEDDQGCQDAICVYNTCREGCRPGQGHCAAGERCNELTFICEPAGCTPTSCRTRIQRCDQSQDPPACVFTGACDTDTQCLAYASQVADGNEYICNQVSGECVARPPCSGDGDCRVGQICVESEPGLNRCRDGCRSSDQCGPGQLCALDQGGICVNGCASDEDCASDDGRSYFCRNLQCVAQCQTVDQCNVVGHVCAGTPRFCQPCSADSQCRSTQFCDFTRGATSEEAEDEGLGLCADLPPECPEDSFGDNHAPDLAYLITEVPFAAGEADDLYFCRKNAGGDWFAINAAPGDLIEIEVEYDTAAGNLDVGLLRANGEEIVASAYPPSIDAGREVIRYGVELGARFLIQVRGSIVERNTTYRLKVNVGPAPVCEDDRLDPNGPDAPALLPAGLAQEGLITCGSSPDYYRLSMGDNQVVRITAQAPDNLGTLRMSLRNEQGLTVATATSRRGTATIFWDNPRAANMLLVVEVASGVGNVVYGLEWRQQDNICTDVFEPNDTCEDAATLPVGIYNNLAVCTDADYYKIELLPFQELRARAIYDPATAAGELDMFLFGPNECLRLAASSIETETLGTQITEVLTYQAVVGGEFYLMTNLFQGLHVPYRLEVEIVDGPPCVDDRLAPNDTWAEAYAIEREKIFDQTESALVGLRVCDDNHDWFAVELEEGDELRWLVSFRHAEGDIDAFLYRAGDLSTPVAAGTSETDDEELVLTVGPGQSGTYYLLVRGKYPVRSSYRLLTYLNGIGPENPLCPDQFGQNDARERSAVANVGTYGPLMVCGQPRSDDWFKTLVRAGETLTVRVDFVHADGRIDLRLFDDTGSTTPLASSVTTRDFEEVSYTTPRTQELFWRVNTQAQVISNTYMMAVSKENPDPCIDDRLAGNHSRLNSAPIEAPGLYTRLRICDDAEDWFRLDLAQGERVEAFIRFAASLADLDLFVYGPDETTPDPATQPPRLVGSSVGTQGTESVIWTAHYTGTYWVHVKPKTPARVDYDLLMYRSIDGVLQGPEDRLCPDAFENNDSFSAARPIAPGSYTDLLVCWGNPTDHDYYSIFVPSGATLSVDLFFRHANGNIDLRVYRGTASQEAGSSRTTDDNESVVVTNSGQGENYVIHVYGGSGSGWRNHYDMDVGLEFAGACDDPNEAGLDRASAKSLAVGAYRDLPLCEGSEHWYAVSLGSGDSVRAELEFNERFGAIDLALVDEDGSILATSAVSGHHQTILYDAAVAGTYYLRVHPRAGAFIRTAYDLWIALAGDEPEAPFCTDPYERNDFPVLAHRLNLGARLQYTDMIGCGLEDDWYQVELTGGTAYEIAAFYDHAALHQLEIVIQDGAGAVLATSSSQTDDALVEFTPGATGAYLVGVRSLGAGGTPYSLHVVRRSVYTNALHCPEDAYWPNGSPVTAANLGSASSVRRGLGACEGDDYFLWTAPNDGPVTMELLFNGERMRLAMEVRALNPTQFVFEDLGDSEGRNRVGGSFVATAGRQYRIYVQRDFAPASGDAISAGPYFLHITQ
jgi:hypothetical protein